MKKVNFFSHETSFVNTEASIGDGTKIWHFSHIREGASIGKNVTIGQNVYIDVDVIVGNNCKIQNNVSIYKGVIIEEDVFIGPSVTFTNDKYPNAKIWSENLILDTLIKKEASIGAGSVLVCGITIGSRSLIGAGSVVTADIPDGVIAFGNPAKVIRSK